MGKQAGYFPHKKVLWECGNGHDPHTSKSAALACMRKQYQLLASLEPERYREARPAEDLKIEPPPKADKLTVSGVNAQMQQYVRDLHEAPQGTKKELRRHLARHRSELAVQLRAAGFTDDEVAKALGKATDPSKPMTKLAARQMISDEHSRMARAQGIKTRKGKPSFPRDGSRGPSRAPGGQVQPAKGMQVVRKKTAIKKRASHKPRQPRGRMRRFTKAIQTGIRAARNSMSKTR